MSTRQIHLYELVFAVPPDKNVQLVINLYFKPKISYKSWGIGGRLQRHVSLIVFDWILSLSEAVY